MKHALGILSRFLLLLIVLILVLGSLVVLTRYVIGYDPAGASPAGIFAQMLAAFRDVVIVSLLVSAALSMFIVIRRTNRPTVPLLALAVVWTGLLVLAVRLMPAPTEGTPSVAAALPSGRLVRAGDTLLYAWASEEGESSLVVIDGDGVAPRITLFGPADVVRDGGTLAVGDRAFDLRETDISYPAMVEPPQRLRPLFRDVSALTALLFSRGTAEARDTTPLILAISLGVFLVACWTPARLTRWPFFNAVLVFMSVRGALWLVHGIHFGELGSLVATVIDTPRLAFATAGFLGFVALVFVVILFLMPPLASWKREVEDE